MMHLLLRGCRVNPHSVSMVNQFMLLGMSDIGGVHLFHEDVPSRWNPSGCGFHQGVVGMMI